MDIKELIIKKSYASHDFVELKKILGNLLNISMEACINLNRIIKVLKKLYDNNYDITFDKNYDNINIYLTVYYPEITIRNNYNTYLLKDIYLIYTVSEVNGVLKFYNIKLVRNTYSIKEIIVGYTHSHVDSEIFSSIKKALLFNYNYRINDVDRYLCLGQDNVEYIISSLDKDNSSNEIYEYFFNYMNEFITFENITGIYRGQTINNILGVTNSSISFEKCKEYLEGDFYIFYSTDTYKYINYKDLLMNPFETVKDFTNKIKKLKINGNHIEVLEFTDSFINDVINRIENKYQNTYKKEGIYYYIKNKKNQDLSEAIDIYENYCLNDNKSKIGLYFRDNWKQLSLTKDIETNIEEEIDNTYKPCLPFSIEKHLLLKASFLITNLYYSKYARKQNLSE